MKHMYVWTTNDGYYSNGKIIICENTLKGAWYKFNTNDLFKKNDVFTSIHVANDYQGFKKCYEDALVDAVLSSEYLLGEVRQVRKQFLLNKGNKQTEQCIEYFKKISIQQFIRELWYKFDKYYSQHEFIIENLKDDGSSPWGTQPECYDISHIFYEPGC